MVKNHWSRWRSLHLIVLNYYRKNVLFTFFFTWWRVTSSTLSSRWSSSSGRRSRRSPPRPSPPSLDQRNPERSGKNIFIRLFFHNFLICFIGPFFRDRIWGSQKVILESPRVWHRMPFNQATQHPLPSNEIRY